MAYVKVKWRKDTPKNNEMSAKDYEEYLLKDRGAKLVVDSYNCVAGQAVDKFKNTQARFGKDTMRGKSNVNIAFEVIHSFSPEQSQKLGPKKVNLLGAELAKRYFPNHEFLVVTHTDTSKTHNHILVNPVNEISGKRDVTDKKHHLNRIRDVANKISIENNLSIIKETDISKARRLPEKVRGIQSRGGKSYRLDLFQKADFAKAYSTSFDEYVSVLNELSVKVAINKKNITYFYEGHSKGIRGNKLGKSYDKNGLIQNFKANDERFEKQPQLRIKIRDGINNFKNGKGDTLGVSSSILLGGGNAQNTQGKNYEAYTKSNRRGNRTPLPSDSYLSNSIIPISEIRKASNSDILEYCKKHKIKTETNSKGEVFLKGKKHISIDGNRWTNTKNKTTGSLIEFVSGHDQTSYLRAISKITNNKNLLLLEQYYGEVKRSYTSFYVPKQKQEKLDISKLKVKKFLKHHGINENLSSDLFKLKKVQVDKQGSIWFYADENKKEAIEFSLDGENKYKSKRHGNSTEPFIKSHKKEKTVTVFTDFLSFLKSKGKKSFNDKRSNAHLVLMGLEEKALHIFLAKNPSVKHIELVEPNNKGQNKNQWNFIDKLKKDLIPYGINVNSISFDKAISKRKSIDLEL
jgi:hypothetical protein